MFNFKPQEYGLKVDYLYEILATTYSIDKKSKNIVPNASCMGIRLLKNNQISIHPFPSTITYNNLRENSFFVINFVDNVYLYALAALKEQDSHIGLTEFPSKYYNFKELVSKSVSLPYISKAWAYLICEEIEQIEKVKKSDLEDYKITEFRLNVLESKKLKDSFNLFNRAENLTIESIILATRIKIAENKDNKDLHDKFLNQLNLNLEKIERFGRNNKVLKAVNLVEKFIDS
ncbi:hypothetical protein LCGC14_1142800 [marine sediment metagenome]|uniref:DUF447 domain-containing protein n=1 Tax=marine sediment metagenome TaxID=412755 RepID=A0A0F9LXW9_9ZZZZ